MHNYRFRKGGEGMKGLLAAIFAVMIGLSFVGSTFAPAPALAAGEKKEEMKEKKAKKAKKKEMKVEKIEEKKENKK